MYYWVGKVEDIQLSSICPPDFDIQHQLWVSGWGGGFAVFSQNNILLTKYTVQHSLSLERLHLVLGDCDRVGILLYQVNLLTAQQVLCQSWPNLSEM